MPIPRNLLGHEKNTFVGSQSAPTGTPHKRKIVPINQRLILESDGVPTPSPRPQSTAAMPIPASR
jgi:hypothetical protein